MEDKLKVLSKKLKEKNVDVKNKTLILKDIETKKTNQVDK